MIRKNNSKYKYRCILLGFQRYYLCLWLIFIFGLIVNVVFYLEHINDKCYRSVLKVKGMNEGGTRLEED